MNKFLTSLISIGFAMTLSTTEAEAQTVPDPENVLVLEVESGEIVIEMLPDVAPQHFDDGTPEVTEFADTLERVCVETVENGQMTKDLALLISPDQKWLTTEEFMAALDANLKTALA